MTPEQKDAKAAFEALLARPDEADELYDHFPESKGGHIISTDIARLLDSRYRNTPKGQVRDIEPGWNLAYRYAQDRFDRELSSRGSRSRVQFMAGGWAAGKTHVLEKTSPPDLAWDGTLSDPRWAADRIDHALKHGWKVEIAYVFRTLELALYGAIERGRKEGRYVPLEELPKIHRKVQRSIHKLSILYNDNPRVSFLFFHNLGTSAVPRAAHKFTLPDIDRSGALYYGPSHERYYFQAAAGFSA